MCIKSSFSQHSYAHLKTLAVSCFRRRIHISTPPITITAKYLYIIITIKQEVNNLEILLSEIGTRTSYTNCGKTPILSGIYMNADNDMLEIQATDYEIGVILHIKAEVENPGEIVVSGRYFYEVVRTLPDEEVVIEYDSSTEIVKISSGKSTFTLLSMKAGDFPQIYQMKGQQRRAEGIDPADDFLLRDGRDASSFYGCLVGAGGTEGAHGGDEFPSSCF